LLSPQDKGRLFERIWSSLFGVKPQPGSGNKWFAKMDVADGQILWSLKYTEKKNFALNRELMKECEDAVSGQGGVGGSTIPGIALSVEGHQYVVLQAHDFIRLCKSGDYKYIVPTKAEQRRARAKIPNLFRDEDE
jgi:hypothetical protein